MVENPAFRFNFRKISLNNILSNRGGRMKRLLILFCYLYLFFLPNKIAGQFQQETTSIKSFASIDWPVGAVLNDGVFLMMHMDHDLSSGSHKDFNCNDQFVYDGHRGTDISAYNFKQMDWGIPIYATADGVVTFVRDGEFDRNYWPPYIGQPNGVVIQHSDGSNSQYWHLRKNSVAVKVGESVKAGDQIALMGSSGQTPIPHLHFELWENNGGNLVNVDPFSGDCNFRSELWNKHLEYPGDKNFRVLDAGIFTKTNLQGNEPNNYFGERVLKDRPSQPYVYGIDEVLLGLWIQSQVLPGTGYKVVIRKKDESVFREITKTASTKNGVQWHVFYMNFSNSVSDDDFGEWNAEIYFEDELEKSVNFTVGEQTILAPRFNHGVGRSFIINGEIQKLNLVVIDNTDDLVFNLIDNLAAVSIDGNEFIVNNTSDQDFRNNFFRVEVKNAAGLSDTARFHIIDYSKSLNNVITSIEEENHSGINNEFKLHQNYPNPFNPTTKISYTISKDAQIELKVVDILGKEVATLVDDFQTAGNYEVKFNADNLTAGVYFYRLSNGQHHQVKKLTLIK